MMPIHWAAFKLALHEWTDPIVRASNKAKELGVTMLTPKIGESLLINDNYTFSSNWWQLVD